jgi:ABC-type maltose transport system permease subunit
MAAPLVMTVPTAVIFFSMQHSIVGGLTAGATKG